MAKKAKKGKAKPYVSKGQLLKSLPRAKPVAPAAPAKPAGKKITVTKKAKPAAKAAPAKAPVKKPAVKAAPAKKISVTRKAKPATVAAKAPAAKGDHWFHNLTKKQQAEYIKAHPRSKYAKAAKSGNTAASAKPSSAKKAKLDAIRDELRALQAKKGSMEPKAYAARLATIKAKLANVSGTAKLPARKTTAKKAPAKRKPAVAKTKLHTAAEKAVKAHMSEKKKLKGQIAKLHARHQKAKASTTPKGKARAAELMKQKKALQAKHAAVHAKHTVAKTRLKKHTDAHKAKAAKAKAKPTSLGRKPKPSQKKVGATKGNLARVVKSRSKK